MMRDYRHVERYLNELQGDVYPQPPDEKHQAWLEDICHKWLPELFGLDSILDVGCGQGQAFPVLKAYCPGRVAGVTLGQDAEVCREAGLEVQRADMTFLPFQEGEFRLIFARHVLEHSPAPLLTLLEWHRVSCQWLLLVLPNPDHYGYGGRNHYYVLLAQQWENLLERAGWHIIWRDESEPTEFRFMCEKKGI